MDGPGNVPTCRDWRQGICVEMWPTFCIKSWRPCRASAIRQPFPPVGTMPSPLVVDALREQLLRGLDWYHHQRAAVAWGVGLDRRNGRGKLRVGAVAPGGRSLLVGQPLLTGLASGPLWLDGA